MRSLRQKLNYKHVNAEITVGRRAHRVEIKTPPRKEKKVLSCANQQIDAMAQETSKLPSTMDAAIAAAIAVRAESTGGISKTITCLVDS